MICRFIMRLLGLPHLTIAGRLPVVRTHDELNALIADRHAREADAIFDEILDIADNGSNDWMKREREDGSVDSVLNHEHVQRSKLRIEARRWMAGKLRPKVYGDKIEHEHTGGVSITVTEEDAGL